MAQRDIAWEPCLFWHIIIVLDLHQKLMSVFCDGFSLGLLSSLVVDEGIADWSPSSDPDPVPAFAESLKSIVHCT
jgi:hypothetical protein